MRMTPLLLARKNLIGAYHDMSIIGLSNLKGAFPHSEATYILIGVNVAVFAMKAA